MIRVFGHDHPELAELSPDDRILAETDIVMFGFCCIQHEGEKRRRIDPHGLQFKNGQWSIVPESELYDLCVGGNTKFAEFADPMVRHISTAVLIEREHQKKIRSTIEEFWANAWKESWLMPVDTSAFQIWKKHDPGAA